MVIIRRGRKLSLRAEEEWMNGGYSGRRAWQMDSGRREGGRIWGATQVPVFKGVENKLEGAGVWWNREASDA